MRFITTLSWIELSDKEQGSVLRVLLKGYFRGYKGKNPRRLL